jgi:RNA polymerase sigma factor (sigma-70 family)
VLLRGGQVTWVDRKKADDAELVSRAITAGGNPEVLAPVFGAIAERYGDTVLRWCANRGLDHQAAQDVSQTVFLEAFTSLAGGRGPDQGDLLGRWLAGFTKNRVLAHFRREHAAGQVMFAADDSFDDLSEDQEWSSGTATRLAHATRLVNVVVASLEERYRLIYQLYFVEQLTGRQIAERLAINEKTASNRVTRVQQVVADGFGALILAQEGRAYCPVLVGLLDAAQVQVITEENFTAALRARIVRHFDTCDSCDRCRICADKRRQLVGPYAPALIPILFGAEFRERVAQAIRQVCDRPEEPPRPRNRRRRRARRRTSVAVGAFLAIVVVAALVLAAHSGRHRPSAAASSATPSSGSGTSAARWRLLRTFTDPPTRGGVRAIAASPDGKTLATGHYDGSAYLWSLASPHLTATLGGGNSSIGNDVESLAFSPDGKTLAAGLGTGLIALRDVPTRQTIATLDDGNGQGGVSSVAFSPDGTTLATGTMGNPGMAVLWNLATSRVIARANAAIGVVAAVAFSPDGKTVAIGSDGGAVLWNPATGNMTTISSSSAASGPVLSIAFSPDGKTLAIGGFHATMLRDLATGSNSAILPDPAAALAFSPDGAILAIGGNDTSLWHTATGRKIASFAVPGGVASIAFLPDGTTLAANDGNGVVIWTSAR